ncbi:hypothetical protein DOTSEDRAFT_91218 [Dothistroma septosporum NZE10]|uniref:Uncharacterized protein n=1 Tax=Dothistroma septosporum (strain NZE10 / CBS 128990) TaxID=675120 RepID=N1PBX5_DOTSN|nr:hypothetical protein DOTSEDRAFT_91218 [Dothistroma septosporum NZE10]
MSVSSETHVGVAQCLDAITQAFNDGGAIIEKIKRKRAQKRAPPPPRLLEESIDQAPHEIEKEKQRGFNRFGKTFEEGDAIAVIALQSICIRLQSSLLEKLRNAAFDDDYAITDFTYLVDAADIGRDKTIAALHELKQRLLVAQTPGQRNADIEPVKQQSFKSTSPNSSKSNIVTPPADPAKRDTVQKTLPSEPMRTQTYQSLPSQNQPRSMAPPRHHKTWSRDFSHAAELPGEDTTSGADEPAQQAHHRKRSSLLHFLKHNRTHSSEVKDNRQGSVLPAVISEEPVRQLSASGPASAPPQQPPPRTTSQEQVSQSAKFRYEEWEDNPEEIWGSKPSLERRETAALAPDQSRDGSSVYSGHGGHALGPPISPVVTHRSNSNPHHSTAIVTPNPDNEFLGFCKGAWKLQNGDRKGAMSKKSEVDPWSRHPSANAAQFLSCLQPKCAFRSSFANQNVDVIWNKVFSFEVKGIKLRWPFLAKSHVQQKVVVKHQYSFKCLFCVFIGAQSGVYHGMDYYLEHIVNEHRGRPLGDVVLYKTGCINDRIADDKDEFDVNLFPMAMDNTKERAKSEYLSDDLMDPCWAKSDANDSMFSANEPWNEGLSDFKYRADERYGVELE